MPETSIIKAMDLVNEAITTAKEVYQESIKKHATVTCNDIIRNIRELTSILMSLEAYRGIDSKREDRD